MNVIATAKERGNEEILILEAKNRLIENVECKERQTDTGRKEDGNLGDYIVNSYHKFPSAMLILHGRRGVIGMSIRCATHEYWGASTLRL